MSKQSQSKKSHSPLKAYESLDFLHSRDARVLRILAEYLEPLNRFRRFKVKVTPALANSNTTIATPAVEKSFGPCSG